MVAMFRMNSVASTMAPSTCVLFVGILIGVGMFSAIPASGGEESNPTSAAAWSAGNAAGVGNFMSYCMPCHGAEGKGDGVLSESLDVKPRNLSDSEFMAPKPDEYFFKIVKNGGAAVGLTENMPPFQDQLSDEEIGNVIAYLRKEICQCEFEKD